MPSYTPPLRDMRFVLHEVLDVVGALKRLPAHAEVDAETIDAVLEEGGKFASEVLAPLNAIGDAEGCVLDKATHEVKTATGFKEAYAKYVEGGWPALSADPDVRRPGSAARGQPVPVRDAQLGEPGVDDVSGPVARRLRMPARVRHRRAEAALSRQADQRPLDRDDVPHRAAVRHRPRHVAHQGRAAGRRQLSPHRQQDLHLRRRARHGGEHRPPRPGPASRRADRLEGHLAVRRAEVERQGRRLARRAERHLVRRPRAQDGNPRQRDRADRPRRRGRLARRPAQQGPAGDVRDDERGAPRRRHAVARPDRGGVPERRGLREGAAADALAVGPEGARQAGRSDHRPPRRQEDAADRAGLRRRRPRAGRSSRRCSSTASWRATTTKRRRNAPTWSRC